MTTPDSQNNRSVALVIALSLLCPVLAAAIQLYGLALPIPALEALFFLLPAVVFSKVLNITWMPKNLPKMRFGLVITTITIVVSILLNLILPWWFRIFPAPEYFQKLFENLLSRGEAFGIWRDLLVLALIPAICEEIFFRGLVQTILLRRFSPKTAVGTAAFIFALAHFNPWFFVFYILLGILFGEAYRRSNLWLSIWAHFLNNAVSLILAYYFNS